MWSWEEKDDGSYTIRTVPLPGRDSIEVATVFEGIDGWQVEWMFPEPHVGLALFGGPKEAMDWIEAMLTGFVRQWEPMT